MCKLRSETNFDIFCICLHTTMRFEIKESSLSEIIQYLEQPLCPLISMSTGEHHPEFPRNLFEYRLLTTNQLDDLAQHFHQVHPPSCETAQYIVTMEPWIGLHQEAEISLDTKRERFGEFVGLQSNRLRLENDIDENIMLLLRGLEESFERRGWKTK